MRRPRKRTPLIVLLLASGGAIVNIAVGWSCAIWSVPDAQILSDIPADEASAIWSRCAPRHWPDWRLMNAYGQHSFGVQVNTVYKWDDTTLDRRQEQWYSTDWNVHEWLVGWPARTARCSMRTAPYSAPTSESTTFAPVVRLPWNNVELPCGPLWPGVAINTIFYAAILWLLFAVPGFVRRRIRIKRGLCPACAYPIGSSDVCTECGRPVAPHLSSPAHESKCAA